VVSTWLFVNDVCAFVVACRDAVNALWEELLSRPAFLIFLLGTLTRPGPRVR
jgi:hypothetical protein